MVAERHRAHPARRPAAPGQWLQTEPVFVAGEDFDRRAGVALGFFRDQAVKFFFKALLLKSYASPCYGGGEAGPVIGAGGEADEVEPA